MRMKCLRATVALLVAGELVLTHFAGASSIGFDVHGEYDSSLVRGGSDPALLLWAAVSIPFFVYVMSCDLRTETIGYASWARRFAAFIIDFYVAMISVAPFLALVPLTAEAFRTGKFSWFFERKYTVPSDWYLGVPLVLFMMALVAAYFAAPLARGRQTVGCYLLGLKVVATPTRSEPISFSHGLRRVFLGFVGLCTWPFMWLLGRGQDGSTWYDRSTGSRVFRIRYR
jgi:uncharacterized RDD family membrane protein YckC